ncbi:hypothetical protein CANCADRAFT_46113 [Tortispora caseinolytica NRRL Y-17796]|uniref:Importin-95 n=1 Tax=Tortispora caseinolytica NRRL Y-17796 TaxID=767744 RepID=A0A1E4TD67_9ASCO|nr:hypothetical protein CANCADRAFT_46113 [Tortispora caseinolytica NRRL Y-17796]
MDLSNILRIAIQHPDASARAQAEEQLDSLASTQFPVLLKDLVSCMKDEAQPTEIRMLAGIFLKNQLSSKNVQTKMDYLQRWNSVDAETKAVVRATALDLLKTPQAQVANTAAQLISAIADFDLPLNQWPELMPSLVANTQHDQPENVKRASLTTIGYICENADPNNSGVVAQSSGILTAIVLGAQSSEPSVAVRIAAINALTDSLEFICENFTHESERNYIMQVVCEASQVANSALQAAVFGALARIMSMYYQYMNFYMERALLALTVNGMQSEDDNVAAMAVEFWCTVCEQEIEIDQSNLERDPSEPEQQNYQFANNALPAVLPTLLRLLIRQSDDDDDDDWTVSMAAGSCLQLFAQATGSIIVPPVLQFVEQNISKPTWQEREAAVMAFGSILGGPDPSSLTNLIRQALTPILHLMGDSNLQVKDTVAWCLGRMADFAADGIDIDTQLPAIIEAVLLGFKDHPRVSTNCCWTLINLTEQLSVNGASLPTTHMSQYYPQLVPGLLTTSDRPSNEAFSRTSAYEALACLVTYAAEDVVPIVEQLSATVGERLSATIQMQANIVNIDDRNNLEELQSSLITLLISIIRRMGYRVAAAADDIMTLLLTLRQQSLQNSAIEEDVLIAIGSVATSIESQFTKYMDAFTPFLVSALENPAEFETCNTAIGLVSDIAQAIGQSLASYANVIMSTLFKILTNSPMRDLRPTVLSALGDVATSLGILFEPYLNDVMILLSKAAMVEAPSDDLDMRDYVVTLRGAILDAYVGIVSGFESGAGLLQPHIETILGFISKINQDRYMLRSDSAVRSAVGLLGDIAAMFPGGEVKVFYTAPWVTEFIKRARSDKTYSASTHDVARWAREQQKRQLLL